MASWASARVPSWVRRGALHSIQAKRQVSLTCYCLIVARHTHVMTPPNDTRSPSSGTKRPATENDRTISPPPLKRKTQVAISSKNNNLVAFNCGYIAQPGLTISSATESAVTNFFTPASQKAKDRTIWSERRPDDDSPTTLLVAKHDLESAASNGPDVAVKRTKIAAFDLVRTQFHP